MTDAITPQQFHDSEGVDDWRALYSGAWAYFHTGSFAQGVAFVDEIGMHADEMDHHPDVDLKYGGVRVHLFTHDVMGLSRRDVALARKISQAAKELDLTPDPTRVQQFELAVDALDIATVMPFWKALLGHRQVGDDTLVSVDGRTPSIWFQQMDAPRPQRNRVHVDLAVPHDQAEARVAAAIEAGGRLVTAEHAPSWWVLADPEGNEACIATWQGRD